MLITERERKFAGSTRKMRTFLIFFPLVFTEGLFSLENSRTIWQVCLKMFMTLLMTAHLRNIICAGAWGIAASIFPGLSSTVLSADFGSSSFYVKKQMGERVLLRGPNTFLAQRYFKHKSARRPQEISGSKFSQATDQLWCPMLCKCRNGCEGGPEAVESLQP